MMKKMLMMEFLKSEKMPTEEDIMTAIESEKKSTGDAYKKYIDNGRTFIFTLLKAEEQVENELIKLQDKLV